MAPRVGLASAAATSVAEEETANAEDDKAGREEGAREGGRDEAQGSRTPEAQEGADAAACEPDLVEDAGKGADEEGADRDPQGNRRAAAEAEGGNAPPSSTPTRQRRGAHPAHRGRVAQAR